MIICTSEGGIEMSKVCFSKGTENLIEISMVFARECLVHEVLTSIDSVDWKQQFCVWANEFEEMYSDTEEYDIGDGVFVDYLEAIEVFTKRKISEYIKDMFSAEI